MSSGSGSGGGVRRVVLVRLLPEAGPVVGGEGSGDHTVHLVEVPVDGQPGMGVGGLCGARLCSGRIETVAPGDGTWCGSCVAAHVTGAGPVVGAVAQVEGSARVAAVLAYRELGWPVRVRDEQVSLNLDLDLNAVAVVVPAGLAGRVTEILIERRCPPAVLAHPAWGASRVFVVGERYDVALSWPTGVHRISGTVLLPPTQTVHGPVRWVRPPQLHSLRCCREIDVCSALITALRELPPSSPSAF